MDDKLHGESAIQLALDARLQEGSGQTNQLVQDSIHPLAEQGMLRATRHVGTLEPSDFLPPEVFGMVLGHLDFWSRVQASHVCCRWRTIAIGMRSLWSNISIRDVSTSLLEDLLERTDRCAVTLQIHCLLLSGMPAVLQLSQHMAHIKDLDVWYISDFIKSPCPLLETLRVHCTSLPIEPEVDLSDPYFGDFHSFPVLRELAFPIRRVRNYNLPALLSICPALQRLEIDFYCDQYTGTLGLTQHITSYAPLLKDFRFWTDYTTLKRVLPHLQSVRNLRVGPERYADADYDGEITIHHLLANRRVRELAIIQRHGAGRRLRMKDCKLNAIVARSKDFSRMLLPSCKRDVSWLWTNHSIFEHLVCFVVTCEQWAYAAHPLPPAPVLQSLTLLLQGSAYSKSADFVYGVVPWSSASWFCPALTTVCIGCAVPRKSYAIWSTGVATRELRLLLVNYLGFSPTRKLHTLVMRNTNVGKYMVRYWESARAKPVQVDGSVFDVINLITNVEDDKWDGLEL